LTVTPVTTTGRQTQYSKNGVEGFKRLVRCGIASAWASALWMAVPEFPQAESSAVLPGLDLKEGIP
jgi:hypothetical protein